jgi:membrane protein insertase Oxa1/YidC/SpoIIIJ
LDTVSGSNYNISGRNFTINGTFTPNGSTITSSGSWTHSSGTFTAGTSTIKMTGTGTANWGGEYGGATKYIYNLIIDGTASITLTAGTRLSQGGKLTLNSGCTFTGNYAVFIYPSTTAADTYVNNGVSSWGASIPIITFLIPSVLHRVLPL